jgi:hypothetical protein
MRAVFGGSWIMGIISASTTARKGYAVEDVDGVVLAV